MCWRVIQAPQFQRLRRVKQLGFSEFVYPGATHSRFTHSVGVFHIARQLAQVLERLRGDGYDRRRAQEAIAAALVHDVGHGPFSHAFEDVLKKLGLGKHESKSVHLIKGPDIAPALNSFAPGFADNVAEIIGKKQPDDIYAAIVSSQFDADRLDYMRRDRFMTGAQSSAIDFEWLLANLDVRRVNIGQDETKIREVETLVVGQKALMAAEAYVLGLFHLYPSVYYHKATRSAEKIFSALLTQIFILANDGDVARIGLPKNHPLIRFAENPDDSGCLCNLDDFVIWGAMPQLCDSRDNCIKELSDRLYTRRLYKAIDVTGRLETSFSGIDCESERDEKRRKAEALIRDRLKESALLDSTDSAPLVLDDVVSRDPYQPDKGDDAALDMIYALDRTGELKELSKLSKVVGALKKYETYRIYYRDEDDSTKSRLNDLIQEQCYD